MKNVFVLIWVLVLPVLNAAPEIKFSEEAWKKIEPIYQGIKNHPFNVKLVDGTLNQEIFAYYSTQDAIYLTEFGKALALLGAKLDDRREIKRVFKEAMSCFNDEKEAREKTAKAGVTTSPATLLYTDFLLSTAAFKSREELAAAVLPCFWIYSKLAREITPKVKGKHPYIEWVKLYSSDKYKKSVDAMIELVDKLAAKAPPEQRSKMLNAFELATRMEWYFWDSAYKMEGWKPLN